MAQGKVKQMEKWRRSRRRWWEELEGGGASWQCNSSNVKMHSENQQPKIRGINHTQRTTQQLTRQSRKSTWESLLLPLSLPLSRSLLQWAEELLKMLPLWGTIFQKLAKKRSQTRRATRHRHRWRPNRARPKLISLDYACYESGNRVLIGQEKGEGEGKRRQTVRQHAGRPNWLWRCLTSTSIFECRRHQSLLRPPPR